MPLSPTGRSASMTEKILCVDDDPNILQAYQRALRKRFHIDVARGADQAHAKPGPPELFAKTLEAGLAQHRLITAERELLSKTLSGSVKMLTEVLSLVSPM